MEYVSDVRVVARSLLCPQNGRALHVVEPGGAFIARVQATCWMVVLRALPVADQDSDSSKMADDSCGRVCLTAAIFHFASEPLPGPRPAIPYRINRIHKCPNFTGITADSVDFREYGRRRIAPGWRPSIRRSRRFRWVTHHIPIRLEQGKKLPYILIP